MDFEIFEKFSFAMVRAVVNVAHPDFNIGGIGVVVADAVIVFATAATVRVRRRKYTACVNVDTFGRNGRSAGAAWTRAFEGWSFSGVVNIRRPAGAGW